jgi:hypothetical protein
MDKPYVGQIVHYVDDNMPYGESVVGTVTRLICQAAIITAVLPSDYASQSEEMLPVDVCVIHSTRLSFQQNVSYSVVHKPGSWHRYERGWCDAG